jgi:DNA helicase-2/ATP-dependent DNA helicase PcrA
MKKWQTGGMQPPSVYLSPMRGTYMTDILRQKFLKARRAVIAREFAHLNDMQLQAVLTTEGPLLLLAGAGSGKTTVLINRIANLIRFGRGADSDDVPAHITKEDAAFLISYAENPTDDGADRAHALCAVNPVEPWRMMAITFTNKAADELKARLERMLGPGARDIWAMTFHAACVRILRRDIDRLGYDRAFTIYDTTDSLALIKRIVKEMNLDDKTFPPRTVLGQISRAKDAMLSAEAFAQEAEKSRDLRRVRMGKIYLEYASRMKEANALDFDDLLLLCVRLLEEHPEVLGYYQRKFRYILIDEYQDTNKLQYRFASALAGEHRNICVVGDDDQSIYRFRGATIENILSFESQYKNARVIRLEQNYRSTARILDAANDVIQNNTGRKGKKLWTKNDQGEPVTLYVARDEREEADLVLTRILENAARGEKLSDHAVLYRMNAQSNQLEFAFRHAGVPYRVVGGTRFFDRAEIKDILAYLCVINNPKDDLRLMRIINTPARGIGQTTLDAVSLLAAENGLSVFEVLRRAAEHKPLQRAAARLRAFVEMIEALTELSRTQPLDVFYDTLLDVTGYIRALEEKQSEENRTRIENVRELKTNIVTFMKQSPEGTLFDFLSDIALYTDMDDFDQADDKVVMMTMHSAKGLEFPTVFIVGAEEGIFPGVRSIGEPEEMEEERRLCYVAITRAKKKLYFTAARRRMIFGQTRGSKVSRFVEEIKPENIETEGVASYNAFDDAPEPERGYGFGRQTDFGRPARPYSNSGVRSRSGYSDYSAAPRRPAPAANRPAPVSAPPPSFMKRKAPAGAAFDVGDIVQHKAFGRGEVVCVKEMGGDALMEVSFEGVGTKRLMRNSAAMFMTKAE